MIHLVISIKYSKNPKIEFCINELFDKKKNQFHSGYFSRI